MEREQEFTWRDGERTILFRLGIVDEAAAIVAGQGWDRFELLTTPRAVANAPMDLAEGARAVHYVSQGSVPDAAAEVMAAVEVPSLVALGGGRVIDTAKAIAAVRGGRVAAIPTTLSGAPMTTFHRLPAGEHAAHLVRPALVIADPQLMSSLDDRRLRATAMNALAHGAEALYTPLANPVTTMAALRGAELLNTALDAVGRERARGLALGSLLCSYAVDSALFAMHHVICQSLVRVFGLPHAETNATMLPHTMMAMRSRAPEAMEALAEALGTKPGYLGRRITKLGGGQRLLSDLAADPDLIDRAVEAIMARAELGMTPEPPDAKEIRGLLEKAW